MHSLFYFFLFEESLTKKKGMDKRSHDIHVPKKDKKNFFPEHTKIVKAKKKKQ